MVANFVVAAFVVAALVVFAVDVVAFAVVVVFFAAVVADSTLAAVVMEASCVKVLALAGVGVVVHCHSPSARTHD